MINALVDLMYKEVVKGKLKDIQEKKEYDINIKYDTKIIKIIDSILLRLIKMGLFVLLISLIFKGNIYYIVFGLAGYIAYRKFDKGNIKGYVTNKKNDIKNKTDIFLKESTKSKLKGLMIILILFNFSQYKMIYIAIFAVVFIFTILDIYSNIKNVNQS
ncbi:hypothetical protein [Alkalithermobacter paradoxus]|uniref:Uncharacterized protein n=1 Tax=Alkalithermobacter paradoxus TaxID=29349 RepID=A0A1V4IA70_9FIRM|nr:hypothetical protein CLOTH_01180 [[Clostridium] thermoalcaliphilum]